MLEFILGYLFGMNNKSINEIIFEDDLKNQIKKSKYVPKFRGYYRNEGTYLNEDWQWIEQKFRKRYLNIYRGDTKTILKGSWVIEKSADETIKCINQREFELMVDSYRGLEGHENIVIYENEEQLVYLNVELKTNITISIDKFKKNDCFEYIPCLNLEEAEEVLIDMKNHYCNYRHVEIRDNINSQINGSI